MSSKDSGTYAEMRFMLAAFEKDFTVCVPFDENNKYDFIIEKAGRTLRVQVKSCNSVYIPGKRFYVTCSHGCDKKIKYSKNDIDILVVYIKSLDTFYLIPIEFINTTNISLFPLRSGSKYIEFKENWNV